MMKDVYLLYIQSRACYVVELHLQLCRENTASSVHIKPMKKRGKRRRTSTCIAPKIDFAHCFIFAVTFVVIFCIVVVVVVVVAVTPLSDGAGFFLLSCCCLGCFRHIYLFSLTRM